jgi:hypothetical protein
MVCGRQKNASRRGLGGPLSDAQDMDTGTTLLHFSNGVEQEWKNTDDASRRGLAEKDKEID